MLLASLRKVLILTSSENQSSNNCGHITQEKIEMLVRFI